MQTRHEKNEIQIWIPFLENDNLEVYGRSLELETTCEHYYNSLKEWEIKIEKEQRVAEEKTCKEKKIMIHKLHHLLANPSLKTWKLSWRMQ